jgi:signal transduction histidine kinase/CheY-like chemotaxis protein/HPt (histidine-containing phosphotransfer) domain-containing protein
MIDKNFAKSGNSLSFMMMGLMAILLQVFLQRLPNEAGTVVALVFIIAAVSIMNITKNQDISPELHARITVVFEIAVVILIGIEMQNTLLYFLLLLQPLFMCMLYLDTSVLQYTTVILLVQHVILLIMGFPMMSGRPGRMECGLFYLIVGTYYFSMSHMIKTLEFRERQSYEQERSLDDMLKVISAKCEEAQNATRSKSDFLSRMSHEIRTPINAILGMNEMILRESGEENIVRYATDVESAGTTLLSLINDILDFSKIETEKMDIIPVEYMVSSIVNDLVNMIDPRVEKKGLKLKVEVNPNMPDRLLGDDVRIKQIITNLLTNAVKYTEKGTIIFSVDYRKMQEGILLLVKVKDTGIGIKRENLDKIFQSFQRVDEVRNRNVEGTGLGLAITSRLLELMDGELRVESEYGKGSVFYATIPQKVVSYDAVGEFSEQIERHTAQRKRYRESFVAPEARILVVDDNKMNLTVILQLLKKTKIQIDTAESGIECIGLAAKKQYDLILMDHMMPNMDGVETLAKLKERIRGFCTPVIALTANAIAGAKDMYLAYGFQDYLSKPIKSERLEKELLEWIPQEKIKMLAAPEKQSEASGVQAATEISRAAGNTGASERDKTLTESDTGISDLPETEISYPPEMNLHAALEYSGDGMSGVAMNAEIFLENAPEGLTKLAGAFAQQDMKNYGIYVHGIKSNLACIGAETLFARAKELEGEAKAGHTAFVQEHHEAFAADCKAFIRRLAAALGQDKAEEPTEELNAEQLAEQMISLADEYDAVGVEELADKLAAAAVLDTKKEAVSRLREAAAQLDFDKIKEAAKALKES